MIWQYDSLYYDQYQKYQSERVKIMPFVVEMDQLYAAADMVISRSGAATLSELCCAARPLCWCHHPMLLRTTSHNAMALADKGAALVIAEKDLDLNFGKCFKLLLDPQKQNEMSKKSKGIGTTQCHCSSVDLIEALL